MIELTRFWLPIATADSQTRPTTQLLALQARQSCNIHFGKPSLKGHPVVISGFCSEVYQGSLASLSSKPSPVTLQVRPATRASKAEQCRRVAVSPATRLLHQYPLWCRRGLIVGGSLCGILLLQGLHFPRTKVTKACVTM